MSKTVFNRPYFLSAVLRFHCQRPVFSSVGGDVISAILAPKLPSNASVVLVLHHPSVNVFVSQMPQLNNTPSLTNVSKLFFRLPPLPLDSLPQHIPWRIAVTHPVGTFFAEDKTASFKFIVKSPPTISRIFPDRLPFQPRQNLVYLLGRNLTGAIVVQDGSKLPLPRIVSASATHIAFSFVHTIQTNSATQRVKVSVVSPDGLESLPVDLIVDPFIPILSARVLSSMQSSFLQHFTIPQPCTNRQPPTIAASLKNFGRSTSFSTVTFNFSLRLDDTLEADFRQFYSGTSRIATLYDKTLFSRSLQLTDRSVAVLVSVTSNSSIYYTVLVISRHLTDKNVGVVVSERPSSSSDGDIAVELHASVAPLGGCFGMKAFKISFSWKIDDIPVSAPLGSSVVVNSAAEFSYSVDVRVLDHSGKILRTGAAHGFVPARFVPISVIVNGGSKYLAVPSGQTNFRIYAEILPVGIHLRLALEWECKQVSKDASCPAAMWPSSVRNKSEFMVSTVGVRNGTTVSYTVRVLNDGVRLAIWSMILNVGSVNLVPFPETVVRSYGNSDPGSLATFSFHCFERVIFSWSATRSLDESYPEMDFWLRPSDNNETNVLQERNGVLITRNGYWGVLNRTGQFLGIDLSILPHGAYVLHSFVNKNTPITPARSWEMVVLPCVSAFISEPSSVEGFANETVFHISAFTEPAIQAVYAVHLQHGNSSVTPRSFTDFDESLNIPTSTVRADYSGATLSFTVPITGQFFITVDIYDASGSRILLSVQSNSTISVGTNPDVKSFSFERVVTDAIAHQDYETLILSLDRPQNNFMLPAALLDKVLSGLLLTLDNYAPPVLTAARILRGCTSVITKDAPQDLTSLSRLRVVAQRTVSSCLAHAASETILRQELQDFFVAFLNLLSSNSNGTIDNNLSHFISEIRLFAADAFALTLSTGVECGSIQRATISYSFTTQVDDFRLGSECYWGQIAALTPEPFTYEPCIDNVTDDKNTGKTHFVMTTEQVDVFAREDDTDILRSGIMRARLFHRATSLNNVSITDEASLAMCYRTRLIVKPTNLILDFSTNQSRDIYCHGVGRLMKGSQLLSPNISFEDGITVSELIFDNSGQIVVSIEQSGNDAVQLWLNTTTFQHCLNYQISTQSDAVKVVPIATGVVTALALLLAIAMVFFAVKKRKSPSRPPLPRNRTGWGSMIESISYSPSSDGSFGFIGGNSNSGFAGWDAAYGAGHMRAGSALADELERRSYDNRSVIGGGDVLAYDEEERGHRSSHFEDMIDTDDLSQIETSATVPLDAANVTYRFSGGLTVSDDLSTPPQSESETLSSTSEYLLSSDNSSANDLYETDAFILPDEFGRSPQRL